MPRFARIAMGLVLPIAALASRSYSAPIPIFEYRFNDSGTTTTSTGSNTATATLLNSSGTATDLHGAAGSGPSGLPGDFAFNNSASTAMGGTGTANTGGVARQSGPQAAVNNLTSLTVTGWFKTDGVAINNNANLVNNEVSGGFAVRGSSAGVLTLENATTGTASSSASYGAISSWVFYAVSYNATASTSNVLFYQGTTTSAPTLVTTASLAAGNTSTTTDPISIGNGSAFSRALDGFLDDTRVFGSTSGTTGVLTLTDINTVWTNDMANVPEPSTGVAILGASCGFGLLRRRGRQA